MKKLINSILKVLGLNGGKLAIDSVFKKFNVMVEDLQTGIQLCREDSSKKNSEIRRLNAEVTINAATIAKAEKLKEEIQKLLGGR